jgi:hypothetical protein
LLPYRKNRAGYTLHDFQPSSISPRLKNQPSESRLTVSRGSSFTDTVKRTVNFAIPVIGHSQIQPGVAISPIRPSDLNMTGKCCKDQENFAKQAMGRFFSSKRLLSSAAAMGED